MKTQDSDDFLISVHSFRRRYMEQLFKLGTLMTFWHFIYGHHYAYSAARSNNRRNLIRFCKKVYGSNLLQEYDMAKVFFAARWRLDMSNNQQTYHWQWEYHANIVSLWHNFKSVGVVAKDGINRRKTKSLLYSTTWLVQLTFLLFRLLWTCALAVQGQSGSSSFVPTTSLIVNFYDKMWPKILHRFWTI